MRIWKGAIWRDSFYRFYLQTEDEDYLITRRYKNSDGTIIPPLEIVWYRDFLDSWNRDDPRPDQLYEIRKRCHHGYYLPVNFSQATLDTLQEVPKDDRPFLEDVFVFEAEDDQDRQKVDPPDALIAASGNDEQEVVKSVSYPVPVPDPPIAGASSLGPGSPDPKLLHVRHQGGTHCV